MAGFLRRREKTVLALCLFLQRFLFGVVGRCEQALPCVCWCEMWVLYFVSSCNCCKRTAAATYTFRDTSKTIGSIFLLSVLEHNGTADSPTHGSNQP